MKRCITVSWSELVASLPSQSSRQQGHGQFRVLCEIRTTDLMETIPKAPQCRLIHQFQDLFWRYANIKMYINAQPLATLDIKQLPTEEYSRVSDNLVRIGLIQFVAVPAIVKGISATVFLFALFFLLIGKLSGEHLMQPVVATAFCIVSAMFFGMGYILQKRP